jgi:acyl-CoA synthetase (AMP-forming)/AMP-acid ligase II
MHGYFGQPEATAQVLQEGWCDTGDQGFFYAEDLYLSGRATDMIIIRGRNHDPAQIEHCLNGIAGLRAGCIVAFGIADRHSGTERLVVLAEYRIALSAEERARLTAESQAAIHASCNLHLAELVLLPPGTLPRTSSGKMRRREACRLWQAGELHPPGKAGLPTMLRQTLAGLWAHYKARQERQP